MSTYVSHFNINKKYVECPYNSNHKIPANRLAIHLTKCERQSDIVLMVCPFNACHRIKRQEYEEHVVKCPNQIHVINPIANNLFEGIPKPNKSVDRLKADESVAKDMKPIKENAVKQERDDEECWD